MQFFYQFSDASDIFWLSVADVAVVFTFSVLPSDFSVSALSSRRSTSAPLDVPTLSVLLSDFDAPPASWRRSASAAASPSLSCRRSASVFTSPSLSWRRSASASLLRPRFPAAALLLPQLPHDVSAPPRLRSAPVLAECCLRPFRSVLFQMYCFQGQAASKGQVLTSLISALLFLLCFYLRMRLIVHNFRSDDLTICQTTGRYIVIG